MAAVQTERSEVEGASSGDRANEFDDPFYSRQPPSPVLQRAVAALDWRDLELFLIVAESGSLRAGAAVTRHAVATVRRRIARMEDRLGEALATRDPSGLRLTPAGERLLQTARNMRASRSMGSAAAKQGGTRPCVRIAVTEGLGTYWLMPRLVEFQNANPQFEVTLHCDMSRSDVAGGQCDVAIQLEPPEVAGSVCLQLGMLHLMPFAADSYLRRAGTPQSIDDWPKHRLVWQEADQVASHLLPYFVGPTDPEGLIGIRTNSSSAHFRAVATGGGIGILPTYARAISRRVRPLDIGVQLRRPILCAIAPIRLEAPEVQCAVAWLKDCFDGDTYPWFQDRFVHPDDVEKTISNSNVITLFEGFIDGLSPGDAD